jgi:hypothetical protein
MGWRGFGARGFSMVTAADMILGVVLHVVNAYAANVMDIYARSQPFGMLPT